MSRPAGAALLQRARANPNILLPAEVLHLQGTVGNRAVSGLLAGLSSAGQVGPGRAAGQTRSPVQYTNKTQIQRGHDDVETDIDWAAASEVKPSESGMMGGVFFITVDGEKHVVKATNSPATVLFGEKMLAGIGGAKIPDSTPIERDSLEGNRIIGAIEAKLNTADDKIRNLYTRKLETFRNAGYLLVQKNLGGGGSKFGLGDLSNWVDAESKQGGDPNLIKAEVDRQVGDQVALLQNETLMKNVGRSLAADTLIGNGDRFENMNTANAFLYTDDGTIGAIDTEAILQNIEAMKEFYDPGSQVPHGGKGKSPGSDPVANYVEFVLGFGVQITSEEGGGAQSSNVMHILTDFDGWFEYFLSRIHHFQLAKPIKEKLIELGYPPKSAENFPANWAAVKINIKAGLNEGLDMAREMMSGERRRELKQTFTGLEHKFGSHINFDWDALKIKGNYIKAITEGQNPEEAKQAALDYVTRKEQIKNNVLPKAQRVIAFGQQKGIITQPESLKLKKRLGKLFPEQQKQLIHVRNVSEKKFKGLIRSKGKNEKLKQRYELARVALLKRYLALSDRDKATGRNDAFEAVSSTAPTIGANLLKGGEKAKTALKNLLQSVGAEVEFD